MSSFYKKTIFRMIFLAGTAALSILLGTLLWSLTVHSQDRKDVREQKEYYKALEQEYVKEMRIFLADQGYADSGVTMNRVIGEDGSLQYVVTIHHGRIGQLDARQKEELLSKCEEIGFPDEDCRFNHRFLDASF